MNAPTKNSTDVFATDPRLRSCFQLIHAKKFDEAQKQLEDRLAQTKIKADTASEGLILSILGLLFRAKNEPKIAYKYYQAAEKCLPNDLSLKMISARLLIEEFRQFETAERKLKTVLEKAVDDFVLQHHATALLAQSHFVAGRKAKAKALFEQMLKSDFSRFRSATSLDFKTCEFFLKKKFEVPLCLDYLSKVRDFADVRGEKPVAAFFGKLLDLFREGLAK